MSREQHQIKHRVFALWIPEAWVNDYAVEIDGAKRFDITDIVIAMGKKASLALKDDDYLSDELALNHGVGLDHSGPFQVVVEDAIKEFWG